MWERTLSEGKIKFLRVRSVLKGLIDKMKCSAVVDRRVTVLAVQALKRLNGERTEEYERSGGKYN